MVETIHRTSSASVALQSSSGGLYSLEDRRDPEGRWGYTSRGPFRGFKLHVAVNQEGLPMKAVVTPGNRYDSPFLPKLIQGLTPERVVADAGYDQKENRLAVKRAGAAAFIPNNPKRKRKSGLEDASAVEASTWSGSSTA